MACVFHPETVAIVETSPAESAKVANTDVVDRVLVWHALLHARRSGLSHSATVADKFGSIGRSSCATACITCISKEPCSLPTLLELVCEGIQDLANGGPVEWQRCVTISPWGA